MTQTFSELWDKFRTHPFTDGYKRFHLKKYSSLFTLVSSKSYLYKEAYHKWWGEQWIYLLKNNYTEFVQRYFLMLCGYVTTTTWNLYVLYKHTPHKYTLYRHMHIHTYLHRHIIIIKLEAGVSILFKNMSILRL